MNEPRSRSCTIAMLSILLTFISCTIANSSDINEALVEAAWNGQTDKVRVLLDAGADVNAQSCKWQVEIYSGESHRMNVMFAAIALALRRPLRRQRGDSILFHRQRGSLENQYYPLNSGHFK